MRTLKPFPDDTNVKFKPAFEERYRKLLGDRYEEFVKYSLSYLTRSVRINTLKTTIAKTKKSLEEKGWRLYQIPFCREGFWVEHETGRLDIGNTLEHSLGYIYVQEAASMIPPLALDPQPGELILDMCASPGSKTTQIAQYMNNEGLLIANDYTGMRMKPLGLNIQRMGITNTVITNMYGQWFAKKSVRFDRIQVDAPCSGTGTIRKSIKTLKIWNPVMVERLCSTQKKLLETAYQILKPGGIVVYSTCSTEPLEDENVVSDFLSKHDDMKLVDVHLKLNKSPAIMEFEDLKFSEEVKKCIRLWPQDNDTEGFFVAKFQKISPNA